MSTPMSTENVTRGEFDLAMARIDARFERVDARFDVMEARLEAKMDAALATSIRWTVGLAFGQYALIFGFIIFVLSREAAR